MKGRPFTPAQIKFYKGKTNALIFDMQAFTFDNSNTNRY